MYVCFLLNNTWYEVVDDIPICMSTGSTNDISPLAVMFSLLGTCLLQA
jgi:hypothetical protein